MNHHSELTDVKVALQLYTVRDAVSRDIAGVLRDVARMGYDGVEFAGFGGVSARDVRDVLNDVGLVATACHISAAALEEDLDAVVADVVTVGAPYVVCPWIDPAVAHDEARWAEFTVRLEGWARVLGERGLGFAYHNHVFEFEARHADRFAFDTLFEGAPGVLVELDAAWAHAGGVSPSDYLRRYARRTPLLHVKDVRLDGSQRETVELGQGVVNLPEVLDTALETGVRWLIVEQDHCQRDPMLSVEANLAWLRGALNERSAPRG